MGQLVSQLCRSDATVEARKWQTKAPEPRVASAGEPFGPDGAQDTDLFAKIERLAELHKKGILSSEEFAAKKAELLSRL